MEIYQTFGIFIVAFLGSLISSLGGVGGGAVLVPLYIFIGNVELTEAIIMSTCTIFGNNLIRSIYYAFKRKHNRFLAQYGIVRTVVIFDANVSFIGYLLNQVLPKYVILLLIIIIIFIMQIKTVNKLYDACFNNKKKDKFETIVVDNIEIQIQRPPDNLLNDKKGESILYALQNLLFCFMQFGIVGFFSYVIRNNDYWYIFYTIQFILISILGYQTVCYLKLEYQLRKTTNFNFIESDISWNNNKHIVKLVLTASFIGALSTMLGIGGGLIITPVLIGFGLHPKSVMATCSIITMFSSAISLIQYLIAGSYLSWYLPVLFIIGGFSSIVSITVLLILRNHGKNIITLCLFLVLILSLALFTAQTIIEYIK